MGETDGHLGPYELRGELGRGAMARVWRAWDPNLGREVAIKEPLFDAGLSGSVLDEMGRRFVKEARIAARLNHPGIVTIYAADVYDGRPAIVMELVEGATLGDILGRNGRLDPGAALDALDQLLDAVGYAHAQGVVHRDIKPDNVFVDEEGRVKLSDFGIARADNGATRATVAGAVLGTPGYMSPEQARGGAVDARSDLFSVGVVAYEMLTGRNPFGAGDGSDAVTLLYRIVHEPPPELPGDVCAGLDADLRPAVMAALEKEPGDRPQSAGEFKAMLHGGPPQAPAQPPAEPRAAAPRRWLPYAAAGVACVAALAIAFFSLGGARSSAPGAPSVAAGMYHLAVSGGRVAIFASGSDEPYEVTDVLASDLDRDSAAEVDGHISFASVQDAEEKVDAYAQAIQDTRIRKEHEAADVAQKKMDDMIASMDGWWHAEFQGSAYGHIEGGTFTIYRPDYPSGVFYRTVNASDFIRCDSGLPGHFENVPGFMIPSAKEGDKNYYITDADFNDNGRIDTISHINSDGSGYVDNETFTRAERPSYVQ